MERGNLADYCDEESDDEDSEVDWWIRRDAQTSTE